MSQNQVEAIFWEKINARLLLKANPSSWPGSFINRQGFSCSGIRALRWCWCWGEQLWYSMCFPHLIFAATFAPFYLLVCPLLFASLAFVTKCLSSAPVSHLTCPRSRSRSRSRKHTLSPEFWKLSAILDPGNWLLKNARNAKVT